MKRAILGAGVLLLAAACGTSGGGAIDGGTVPAGQRVQAPAAAPTPAPPAVTAPVRSQPTPAPQHTAQEPAGPTAPPSSATGSGPAERDGVPPCPMGTPPLHKLCPQ